MLYEYVGLTAVNALAEDFKLQIFREEENYTKTIVFHEGEKIGETVTELSKHDKQHGSIVTFKPSKKFLGANAVTPLEDLEKWISTMMYLMDKKSKLKVELVIMKGMKLVKSKKYKPQDFSGLLEAILPAGQKLSQSSIVYLEGSRNITETVRQLAPSKNGGDKVIEKKLPRKVTVQVVFGYGNDSATLYDSYCNYTNTTNGGVHLNTFEQVFCRYMATKTMASMTDAQKDKMKILWEDVKYGLCAVINLSTNAQVGFVGNAKQEVGNEELAPVIKEILQEELDKYFSSNGAMLNDMVRGIKSSAKARIEMAKVKSATQKEKMNSFKEYEMKKFIPCNNRKKGEFKELFIVEGDSPSSSGRNGCDPDTQAFLMFRGVTANAFKCSLAEIMENNEFKDLVTVLRCGIGKSFDINKLFFDRINILTDGDIDGFGISSSILAFFYRFMPELIEAGKVYKVFAPLYKLDDSKHPFVANRMKIIELYQEKIVSTYKVKCAGMKDYFDKKELYKFLDDTYDYPRFLSGLAGTSGKVNKFLCEKIIAIMVITGHVRSEDDFDDLNELFKNQKFITKIMSAIQTEFPESWCENNKIIAVSGGKTNTVRITPRFIQKCSDLIPIYQNYGFLLEVKEKGKDPVTMTIGEFHDSCHKFMSKILYRYKGLGELEPQEIFETTLSINNRTSAQFTMEDAKRELEIFNVLHSPSKIYREKRKKMMMDYKIRMEDLDN